MKPQCCRFSSVIEHIRKYQATRIKALCTLNNYHSCAENVVLKLSKQKCGPSVPVLLRLPIQEYIISAAYDLVSDKKKSKHLTGILVASGECQRKLNSLHKKAS